ncbi:profilin, required for normal timing of actin polymerization in response to thermal stress [Haplosporangium bisporale]|nr:profilin, required for normal timing of actin polymerization in response to thermal stress [Haplosporangium bisporale]
MSWQEYVDKNMVLTGKVSKASIFGHDGSLWATSSGFQVGEEEAKKLVAAFTNSGDAFASGLYVEGKKFVVLNADDKLIRARQGATGIICAKTSQCVLIGYYNENIQAGDCSVVVENLAEYLRGVGY